MKEELRKYIVEGDFKNAYELYHNYTANLEDYLVAAAYETGNLSFYLFSEYLILVEDKAYCYYMAAFLLVNAFTYVEGAYYIAFEYIKNAVKKDLDNIGYKEFMLFFYDIPDRLLSYEDAVQVAESILNIDKNNQIAKNIMERSNNK